MARLSSGAKKLFDADLSGIKEELEAIRFEASGAVDGNDIKALTLRKQICQAALEVINQENGQRNHDELVEDLRATRDALNQRGGGSTSFSQDLQLPCENGDEAPQN